MNDTKVCDRCDITKPLRQFLRKKAAQCRACSRKEFLVSQAANFPGRLPKDYGTSRRARDPEWGFMQKIHSTWRSATTSYVMEALGYTPQEARQHLEDLFEPWMTWENYGEWSIDHIQPQSTLRFGALESENFHKCWSLENLRPLCIEENTRLGIELTPSWAKAYYSKGNKKKKIK